MTEPTTLDAIRAMDWSTVPKIGIGWEISNVHGWGIHGYHLARRMIERHVAFPQLHGGMVLPDDLNIFAALPKQYASKIDYPIIWGGGNENFERSIPDGDRSRDRIIQVFEQHLSTEHIEMLRDFGDRVICVSKWNTSLLQGLGIPARYFPVGVDTKTFAPKLKGHFFGEGKFVVFSGGKAEYRKGQDIVLAAFKIFQERHVEAMLVSMWHNHWPHTAAGLVESLVWPHTLMQFDGKLMFEEWSVAGDIPVGSHEDIGLVNNAKLAVLLQSMDVAVFPNRCEGGTNMVAMECLASGVPTILSDNSGHSDLIRFPIPCYALERQAMISSTMRESDVEEVLEALEHVYQHRTEARATGVLASEIMGDHWDWDKRMDAQIDSFEIVQGTPIPIEYGKDRVEGRLLVDGGGIAQDVRPDSAKLASHFADLAAKLRDGGAPEVGIALAKRAYALNPNDGAVVGQLGNLLISSHHPGESLGYTKKALALRPDLKYLLGHNTALGYMYSGQVDAALRELEKVKNSSLDAAFDYGVTLMLSGKWKEGWQAQEVRRQRSPEYHGAHPMPEWRGEEVDTLWVTVEQGIGDTFMFARYIPWARERCKKLIFSVWPELMPLFIGYPGVDVVLPFDRLVPAPLADAHVPLQSLALYYGTLPSNIPPDPCHFNEVTKMVTAKLTAQAGMKKVGLVWAGSAIHPRDIDRSMMISELFPLIEVPYVQLYAMQVGPHSHDVEAVGAESVISNIADKLTSWHATGAALLQLDLLITVDTAIAHMAGALGVPTLLMLCKLPDWRWMMKGTTTPWYPSVTLVRQKVLGDWSEVIQRVKVLLSK